MNHTILVAKHQLEMNEVMHTNYAEHLSFLYSNDDVKQTHVTKEQVLALLNEINDELLFEIQTPLQLHDGDTLEFFAEIYNKSHNPSTKAILDNAHSYD